MTTYNVHIYREMRLVFGGIQADTPEAAASIAHDKPTGDADDIDDCEGETFAALVDVQGDDEYEHSRFIDFEVEQQRKAAPKLLAALKDAESFISGFEDDECQEGIKDRLALIRSAIAEAHTAGIPSAPAAAPGLLAVLKAVLPYAENERSSLRESWKRDGDLKVREELDACDRALDRATAAMAGAKDTDIHALLEERRQIAAIWGIEDVQEIRPDLTDEQAWEVLQYAGGSHDATIGIDWDVLACHAETLFGTAPETDEA
jgi:hypothetical protein